MNLSVETQSLTQQGEDNYMFPKGLLFSELKVFFQKHTLYSNPEILTDKQKQDIFVHFFYDYKDQPKFLQYMLPYISEKFKEIEVLYRQQLVDYYKDNDRKKLLDLLFSTSEKVLKYLRADISEAEVKKYLQSSASEIEEGGNEKEVI